jgi:hypothetical protein
VGRSLVLGIRVRQLPDGRQLVLKTVQSYADGKQDAWIEVPSASVPEPDMPAPIVRLQAAAPGATVVPPATPAPTTPAPVNPPTTVASTPRSSGAAPAADTADDGSEVAWMFGGVLAGIAALGAIVVAARRRLR